MEEERDEGTHLEREINGEEQVGEREEHTQVKRDGGGGRVVLGLRLSRNRLHLVFKRHGGFVQHWVFRGIRLVDNQWHTLALTISGRHARLTVDCSSPLEM